MSSASEAILNLRGMGAFIPYARIEDLVRKTGEAVIAVDESALNLVRLWAKKRGYGVTQVSPGVLRITASAMPATEEVAEELLLEIADREWDSELSKKLSDISTVVEIVLKAPILYRGRIDKAEIGRIVRRKGTLLLRFHIGASDYFFAVRGARVIAAASVGAPLNPMQARNVLQTALKDKNASITVYDISSI
ncbi:hypothetical protein PYJP_01420 [Pyrofollis japonicus]|uniref:hypothetical protein n=1 Tax=Pyrofollis japonicus TaxID=3060460 RepID=UPI00295C1BE4|nr:hypothetical protein [Pyrofollis japonicus]BEP16790.1 hypothetical protein PYJP_01420 [Pyrofollis japonicus]